MILIGGPLVEAISSPVLGQLIPYCMSGTHSPDCKALLNISSASGVLKVRSTILTAGLGKLGGAAVITYSCSHTRNKNAAVGCAR